MKRSCLERWQLEKHKNNGSERDQRVEMSSQVGNVAELLEIDICDGDICSEGESGVFINSDTGASLSDGFSAFQQWTRPGCRSTSGHNNTGSVSERPRDCSSDTSSSCPSLHPQNGLGSGTGDRVTLGDLQGEDVRAPRSSIVDCLLVELYDTYSSARLSVDSPDSSTEASSSELFCRSNTGSSFLQELQEKHTRRHQVNYLSQKAPEELRCIIEEVLYRTGLQSAKLLRQLKRRDRFNHKLQKKYDIITACLQAVSQKRRADTRLKFTIEPALGKNGFQQWYDALKAVVRLPTGIPKEWRKRVWLTLADQYLHSISIDWDKTLRFAFNERSNPDDDSLGIQIVKDLHRTGCSSYSGQEGEQDRVVLKRVLLAYARWNKAVGYCQGFNVLAALILEVTEGNESHALKVMIYLIDKVLPESYFANNLRSLSVDMAVFRDLLRMKLPRLSQHLHHLQKTANREAGGSYEPPLTNVFMMQWFLTMFATCLPPNTVLKIWDSVFFDGSEVLLRVALAIWSHLGERIENCQTADHFYSTMGWITQEMLENSLVDCSHLMQTVYSMAVFPFPQLAELREKYTYNITPFPTSNPNGSGGLGDWEGDEDVEDDEDAVVTAALGCLGPLGGLLAPELQRYQRHIKDQRVGEQGVNMADLSPGAVGGVGSGGGRAEHQAAINSMMQERMSTDISALKKQYSRIKRHQQQQARQLYIHTDRCPVTSVLGSQLRPSPVVNHLLLGRKPRNSLTHPPSSLLGAPQAQSSPANPGPNPTPRGERGRNRLVSQAEDCHSRVGSPWRAHVRAHRRNIARARVQLGFGNMEEEEEEEDRHTHQTKEEEEEDRHTHQTEEEEEEDRHTHQTKEEDRHSHQTKEEEERDGVGEGKAADDDDEEEEEDGSHLPVSPAQAFSKEVPAVVEKEVEVEEHLVSLELKSGSEPNQTPPPQPSSLNYTPSPTETTPPPQPASPTETTPDTLPSSPTETTPDTLPSSPTETTPDTLPSSPTETTPDPQPASPTETTPPPHTRLSHRDHPTSHYPPLPQRPPHLHYPPLPQRLPQTHYPPLPQRPPQTHYPPLPQRPPQTHYPPLPQRPPHLHYPPLPQRPPQTHYPPLPQRPPQTHYPPLPQRPPQTHYPPLPQRPPQTHYPPLPQRPPQTHYPPLPQRLPQTHYPPLPQRPPQTHYPPLPQRPPQTHYPPLPQRPPQTHYPPLPPSQSCLSLSFLFLLLLHHTTTTTVNSLTLQSPLRTSTV
ncbi:TBC1 domain family member 30 isoform X2 [Coregonus clupeaformis]|uniref:TBC1 domain family member 30 isoform X2 n=1 Tax=Coregonus clupeaformis TaxID=59861 RepID=UPI001E1C489C|nr:TBC1 domain family member 30 isoform X2 [Coregonus clupeaformis]